MKANELMIGDFVTFKECQNDEVKPAVKIWQLNEDNEAFAFIDSEDALEEIEINDEIIGIPLTSEILKKNGFQKSDKYAVWKIICDDYEMRITPWRFAVIFLDDEGCDKEELSFPRPQYVHELQHCLKMVGIDKDIIL